MPMNRQAEKHLDREALTAHLLSKGLVPKTRKWDEVWFRKMHKFIRTLRG